MGLEIVRNRPTRGIWTLPIFVLNALRSSTLFLSKSTCPNLIAFTIIGQINQKVPDDQHVDFFFWERRLRKNTEHYTNQDSIQRFCKTVAQGCDFLGSPLHNQAREVLTITKGQDSPKNCDDDCQRRACMIQQQVI